MIYSREAWQPNYGRGHVTDGAKTIVVVHNDSIAFPSRAQENMTIAEEAVLMRFYESYHASKLTKDNKRLAYQFVLFPSTRLWEGIGWDRIGAHTAGMNSSAVGLFVPVNGNEFEPSDEFVRAFDDWRAEGVRLGKLSPNHLVKGHQDYGKPSCPGSNLYEALVEDSRLEQPRLNEIVDAHPSMRIGKGGKKAPLHERLVVKYLQERLSAMGFMNMPHEPGYFGSETDIAVRRLQLKAGLRRALHGGSAIVGPATWKVLDAAH